MHPFSRFWDPKGGIWPVKEAFGLSDQTQLFGRTRTRNKRCNVTYLPGYTLVKENPSDRAELQLLAFIGRRKSLISVDNSLWEGKISSFRTNRAEPTYPPM